MPSIWHDNACYYMYIVVLSDSYIYTHIYFISTSLFDYIHLFFAGTLWVYNVDMFLEDILRVANAAITHATPSKFQVGAVDSRFQPAETNSLLRTHTHTPENHACERKLPDTHFPKDVPEERLFFFGCGWITKEWLSAKLLEVVWEYWITFRRAFQRTIEVLGSLQVPRLQGIWSFINVRVSS